MLTGDNRTTADAVAAQLGIDEVEADVLPEQKARIVKRLRAKAASSRWPATASTTRRRWPRPTSASPWAPAPTWRSQSAGVTLVKGDLAGIARARALSRATMRNTILVADCRLVEICSTWRPG